MFQEKVFFGFLKKSTCILHQQGGITRRGDLTRDSAVQGLSVKCRTLLAGLYFFKVPKVFL